MKSRWNIEMYLNVVFLFDFNRNYASILYRFRISASYLPKVPHFNLLHLHLAPPLGWRRSNFTIFNIRKLECLTIVWRCLRDPVFSRFWYSTDVWRTDRRTDMRQRLIPLCIASRGKKKPQSELHRNFLRVASGRGSVLLCWHCDSLCTSGLWMTSCFHIMGLRHVHSVFLSGGRTQA